MQRVRLTWMVAILAASWGVPRADVFEDRTPRVHALVGARVVPEPGRVLENATIVVRDGIVTGVGKVKPPADARIWNLDGRTVYAGWIDPWFVPDPPKQGAGSGAKAKDAEPGSHESEGMRHPNANVRAERRVVEMAPLPDKVLESLRAAGLTAVHRVPRRGIFRGQSAVVQLRDGALQDQVLRADVAQIVAFDHGGWSDPAYRKNPTYPSSLMGAVALVRQTLLDAQWIRDARTAYARTGGAVERPRTNLAWEALQPVVASKARQPVWLVTRNVLGSLRCTDLAREFELDAVLVGNGEEYQEIDALAQRPLPTIVPVAFPAAPKIDEADEELFVELETLEHWQQAPKNPGVLRAHGIPVALTSDGLKKRASFRKQVGRAVAAGLDAEAAVAALTTEPARLLGVGDKLGRIAVGAIANFTVTDGPAFEDDTRLVEVWVDGERYPIRDPKLESVARVRGTWTLKPAATASEDEAAASAAAPAAPAESAAWTLKVEGNRWTLRARLEDARGEIPVQDLDWHDGVLRVVVQAGERAETLELRPRGKGKLEGAWQRADGSTQAIEAQRPEPTLGGAR